MATKKQSKGEDESQAGTTAGQDDMPGGDMHQPVKDGLMEMPGGGETHSSGGGSSGGTKGEGSAMESNPMPGESQGTPAGGQMPGGGMSST